MDVYSTWRIGVTFVTEGIFEVWEFQGIFTSRFNQNLPIRAIF